MYPNNEINYIDFFYLRIEKRKKYVKMCKNKKYSKGVPFDDLVKNIKYVPKILGTF